MQAFRNNGLVFVFLVSLFIFSPIFAMASATTLTAGVSATVEHYEKSNHFHGNVMIVRNGKVEFARSYGFANMEHEVPNTRASKFIVGSIAKQFTAALILQLEEQGLLHLDEKINRYIDVPDSWRAVSVRQLLDHTAGVQRDVPNTAELRVAEINSLPALAKTIFQFGMFQDSVPGKTFSYSNAGYTLLAYLAEQVTGRAFPILLKSNIFDVAGMFDTGFYHRSKVIKNMAEGYYFDEKSQSFRKRCCDDSSNYIGSHNVYSTVDDLVAWSRALREGDILTRLSRNRMILPHARVDEKRSYGLAFFIDEHRGYQRLYHDGHSIGYLSKISHIPALGTTTIILANSHVVPEVFYHQQMHEEISDILINEFAYNRIR